LEGQINEEFENILKLKASLETENENLKSMFDDLKEEKNNELIKYYSVSQSNRSYNFDVN
jgi:hypothetical protein